MTNHESVDSTGWPVEWLADVAFACPNCGDTLNWKTGIDVTIVHAARRLSHRTWSIGYQCPGCRARIVARAVRHDGDGAVEIEVAGFSAPTKTDFNHHAR